MAQGMWKEMGANGTFDYNQKAAPVEKGAVKTVRFRNHDYPKQHNMTLEIEILIMNEFIKQNPDATIKDYNKFLVEFLMYTAKNWK